MTDLTHLDALQVRLSHERGRLAIAKKPRERQLRQVWIDGIEREIANEYAFLGIAPATDCSMSDDELLAALGA